VAQNPHSQAPFTQDHLYLSPQHQHHLFQDEYGSPESIFQLEEYGSETWEIGPVPMHASDVDKALTLPLNQDMHRKAGVRQDLGIKMDSNLPRYPNLVSFSQLPTDVQETNTTLTLPTVNQGTSEGMFASPKGFPQKLEYSEV